MWVDKILLLAGFQGLEEAWMCVGDGRWSLQKDRVFVFDEREIRGENRRWVYEGFINGARGYVVWKLRQMINEKGLEATRTFLARCNRGMQNLDD